MAPTYCRGGICPSCKPHRAEKVHAGELNKRCRPHLKPTNKSYRTDETYIKVKGEDKYLYRAVDSTGQTIVRSRLPEELWSAAAKLARRDGHPIAPSGACGAEKCCGKDRDRRKMTEVEL